MRMTILHGRRGRVLRWLVLGAGSLLFGGCATGYSLVQPSAAGAGAYYTGDAYAGGAYAAGAYADVGYGGAWSVGGYYPGPFGFGYYGGWPYDVAGGWYGSGSGFGAPFALGFGVSNAWGYPGYWSPRHAGGRRNCGWQCSSRRGHYRRQHADQGAPGGHGWRGDQHAWQGNHPHRRWSHEAGAGAPTGVAAFARPAFIHAPTRPARIAIDTARPDARAWRAEPMTRGFSNGAAPFSSPAFRGMSSPQRGPAFRAAPRFAPTPAMRAEAPRPAVR
jgi:hypothetical protein